MRYERRDRRAIRALPPTSRRLFDILEKAENGVMVAISELCSYLDNGFQLISFSCLSGDQDRKTLGDNLGSLFAERKIRIVQHIVEELRIRFTVFIDDTEPIRIWQWPIPQEEITEWCQLVIDNTEIPEYWDIKLWSHLEICSGFSYKEILQKVMQPEHALTIHHRLSHMKEFPNRKVKDLRGKDLEDAATCRVAQYALQGAILEEKLPKAILLQCETPWAVKDPLYQSLRNSPLPIIHPLEERR